MSSEFQDQYNMNCLIRESQIKVEQISNLGPTSRNKQKGRGLGVVQEDQN